MGVGEMGVGEMGVGKLAFQFSSSSSCFQTLGMVHTREVRVGSWSETKRYMTLTEHMYVE